jgi:hypothetical protein
MSVHRLALDNPKVTWMAQLYDGVEVNSYSRRNEIVFEMGFTSYRAYLRSKLWKEIRGKKLQRDKNCWGCDKRAQQVHHGDYHRENLTGQSEKDLYSICKRCHRWIEFDRNGSKRDPQRATEELRRIRRIRLGWANRRVDNRVKMVSRVRTIHNTAKVRRMF